jgi:hypothetical protein
VRLESKQRHLEVSHANDTLIAERKQAEEAKIAWPPLSNSPMTPSSAPTSTALSPVGIRERSESLATRHTKS